MALWYIIFRRVSMKKTKWPVRWVEKVVGELQEWQIPVAKDIKGIFVEGDKKMPPTAGNLFQRWQLKNKWNVVSILAPINPTEGGYYIGFKNFRGEVFLREKSIDDWEFGVLNGYEDCTFFALDLNGKEIELELVRRTTKSEPTYADTKLY